MLIATTIQLSRWDEFVKHKVVTYWEQRGIIFTERSGDFLVGKRGSIWGNLLSFDMSRLLARLTISRVGSKDEIKCSLDVNTAFQSITEWNRAYWWLEMETFESYLQRGDLREKDWERFLQGNRKAAVVWTLTLGFGGNTLPKAEEGERDNIDPEGAA